VDLDSAAEEVGVRVLSRIGADYFGWADGGATATWSLGSSFFQAPVAAPSAAASETRVTLELQTNRPGTAAVFRGARVITMGPAGVLENADVVVRGNRIESVGAGSPARTTSDLNVIAADGMTIIPGLIDNHVHFLLFGSVLDPDKSRLTAALAYGVTTGRDPQSTDATLLAYQDLWDSGRIRGPRIFTSGPGVLSGTRIASLDDARTVLRKYKDRYRTDFIKSYVVGNRQQRRWVSEACRELGLMSTTEGASDLKLDLTHAIDGFTGNEHSFGTFPLYQDVVELLVRSGSYTTFTLMLGYGGPLGNHYFEQDEKIHPDRRFSLFFPAGVGRTQSRRPSWFHSREFIFRRQAQVAKAIARSGGAVCLGTDSADSFSLHWSMWAATMGGLTPLEVLGMTTIEAAKILGYAQDLGSIEPGKLADLVVLTKNPLEDIHNTTSIKYVMRNGELYDAETMDRILPTPDKRPTPWWIADEPRRVTSPH
jgi:hypothetical protein